MEFNVILENLKKKIYHPIYLFQGEEPYYIDKISNYIEKNVLLMPKKDLIKPSFTEKILTLKILQKVLCVFR